MDTDHWNTIETILDEALQLPKKKRQSYIKLACDGNSLLYKEITSLLTAIDYSEETQFLQKASAEHKSLIKDLSKESTYSDFIGRRIGVFKIIEQIGFGGMALVFKAERDDGQFDQKVAIKLVRQGFRSEETLKRFQLEKQILAGLNHPNIARLYDGGITSDGHPYLIMELIEGMPIDEYCNHHALTIPKRLELFEQVCRAVEFAHRNLVIHRDLKAQNIFVTSEGLIKILDFGIAKLLTPELQSEDLVTTIPGHQFWTPHYSAPEQILEDTITTATDVYSLGVLLYKLLVNRYPFNFEGKSLTQIKSAITDETPGPLLQSFDQSRERKKIASQRKISVAELQKIMQSDLSPIVNKAIRKRAADRYGTVGKLMDDIENYTHNRPVSAQTGNLSYRMSKFFRRHRTGLIFACVILMLFMGFTLFYTLQITKERNQAQAETNKAEQVTSFLIGLFEASDPTEARGDTATARELLQRGLQRAEALKNQPEVQNQMFETMGRVYRRLGQYEKSHELLQQAFETSKKVYGPNNLETASSLDHLGMLLSDQGDYSTSEALLRQSLQIRMDHQDAYHPAIAETQNLLAYSLRKQGKYDEAEKLYRSSLQIRKLRFGTDHPKTVAAMSSLGTTLHNKGDYSATEKLYRQVLSQNRRLLGPVHPDLAMNLNNLAALLMNTGRLEEAKKLLMEALEMRRKVYGPNHPKVALTMNNLAMVQRDLEDFSTAESTFKHALSMRKNILGDNHVGTAISQYGLGELMLQTGKADSALALFRQAFNVFNQKLSKNHSFTIRTKMNIGRAEMALGSVDEAEKLMVDSFAQIKTIHSDSTLERALADQQMGLFYFQKGNFPRAKALLSKAYHTFQYIEKGDTQRQRHILAYLDQIDSN